MFVFCINLNEVNGTNMEIAVQNFHRGSGMCLFVFFWFCLFLFSVVVIVFF